MKANLLLSTLVIGRIGVTPSFAQSVSGYSRNFGYPSYAGGLFLEGAASRLAPIPGAVLFPTEHQPAVPGAAYTVNVVRVGDRLCQRMQAMTAVPALSRSGDLRGRLHFEPTSRAVRPRRARRDI
jgi:hypothetical protein